MLEVAAPVAACLFLWWLGTGIVLRLDSLPERTYRCSVSGLTALAVVVLANLILLRHDTSVSSAYVGFVSALVLWGWLEFMHYSGFLLGPSLQRCPPNVSTRRRFVCALQAMLYHELALALMGAVLLLLMWQSPNKTALYTYLVLWIMRISAELNVFLGVAYLPEEWLPRRLQYLMSYRSGKRLNLLFPVSVGVASVVCVWIFSSLPVRADDAFGHTTLVLTGTLLFLAILEHWLLVVPSKTVSLWSWAHSRAT